ncbi:hypothetical protein R1sor_004009 [Riccia sorocarpa]|uniref:Uncharacterized protein n=1 Tax=Riccia sorocarpa TaxID=122646 RepID=A0ABD3H647_9MARC
MVIDRDPSNRVVSPRQRSPGACSLDPGDLQATEVLTQLSEKPVRIEKRKRRHWNRKQAEEITEQRQVQKPLERKKIQARNGSTKARMRTWILLSTQRERKPCSTTSTAHPLGAHEPGSSSNCTPEARPSVAPSRNYAEAERRPSEALEHDASRRTKTATETSGIEEDRGKKPVYEGTDEDLDIFVDLGAQTGQHHTSSSSRRTHETGSSGNRTPEAGPSVAPGRDYAEAKRRYWERLYEVSSPCSSQRHQTVHSMINYELAQSWS